MTPCIQNGIARMTILPGRQQQKDGDVSMYQEYDTIVCKIECETILGNDDIILQF